MQILPTSGFDSSYGLFSNGSDSQGDFNAAMSDALASVNDGDALNVDEALEEAPHVDSPYTRHSTDGVTYTMSEVLFTKSELAELRLALLKEGAPEDSLKQFDILADQPNGATLAQVLASLAGVKSEVTLRDDDRHAITALLGQIDPTGDLAADALGKMASGNGEGALALIQGALQNRGGALDLNLNDVLALGRGLGLSADSLRQLAEKFNGASSLSLNAEGFDGFMTPAKNQFMQEAANSAKLEAALDKTLRPIISKARNRMEQEKLASERESRRVQQSKVLIDKTVKENSNNMLDEMVAEADAQGALKRAPMTGHAGEALKQNLEELASNNANARNIPLQNQGAEMREPASFTKNESDGQKSGQEKSGAWNDLLTKVEVKPQTTQSATASSLVYAMLQNDLEAAPLAELAAPRGGGAFLSRQVAGQVEQGILTALGDGATRLDLQLHPAELGQLAITLIARNGEVTALIKSEKTETAEIMQRQLDAIRVNLENQGVRVDRIEVQTETQQDGSRNVFDDLGGHNARQEEEARRQELQRIRNLASLRAHDAGSDVLAQSVHNISQTARYAGQALHVVA